ncbi:hypothetical protein N9D28_01200 [Luminiphilus sp.]|nr:hypothetical protein [Luminiphilus sp.]
MHLDYQSQESGQTLREAIAEYHRYLFGIDRKILVDSDDAKIWHYHDATHAIFGHSTSIEQEAALDFWVLFGTNFSWKMLRDYNDMPEIKAVSGAIISELGLFFIPKLYWRNRKVLWRVFRNTGRMSKKWPFEVPSAFLDRTLSDLRREFGIRLLSPQQRVPTRLTEFDYSIVSNTH